MPTHDEHGCHNHCIVECSEEEQLCLGQAGHDHHEGHEHDRDFHDHGDCAEPDFCIHKDRKNFFSKIVGEKFKTCTYVIPVILNFLTPDFSITR